MARRSPTLLLWMLTATFGPAAFAADDGLDFFEAKIRPILAERCERCHGSKKQQGGLRLDSKSGWARGGDQGAAVVPGNPEESLLIQAVRYDDEVLRMPPGGRLPEQEVAA